MARAKGTAILAASLEVQAGAPLDARQKVALKADLTAANTFPYSYEGMEVYVTEEKKKYILIGEDPTVAGNWQEVGSGSEGSAKVNATAVTSLTSLEDGFYLLIDTTATPIYQLKEVVDGVATDSDKEVDTCLIDYTLYNDNKTVLDTLDIVWVVTGTPDISDYKTEFETAKSGVRINADHTFEWDSDVFSVGDFADLKSQWNAFAVFMHNNKGRLAMITIDQYDFGFSDDDTGGSSPTLICIIPEIAQTTEDYSIRIPYGSATSIHGDGYGSGFIDISWRLAVSSGKCDFAGINTTLFKGTDSMSTGYAYFGSSASSVYINETEYSMNDPTEKAAAYNLYHQGVSIIVKLL